MIRLIGLCVILGVAALGCFRSPGGVAPSNIPLSQDGYTVLGPVKASDCKYNLLGLIPVSGGNQAADAIKEALGDEPGADAMINITLEGVSKYFILWSQACTDVRGTAVRVK